MIVHVMRLTDISLDSSSVRGPSIPRRSSVRGPSIPPLFLLQNINSFYNTLQTTNHNYSSNTYQTSSNPMISEQNVHLKACVLKVRLGLGPSRF